MPVNGTVWAGPSSTTDRLAMGSRVGGSFTGCTVRRKLVLLVSPSGSATVTVMFAVPDWLSAGTMFTVRLAPDPPNVTEGTSEALADLPLKMRLAAAVSGSLMVKLMLVATSSPIVRPPIGQIVGGSLIGRMVSRNESLLVAVPSVANTVMVTVPT